ncbi:hypothetical protein, partial [Propionivibrio sp.]|uniref:hypothetical protein n=1 Tax=Propionivibrio sp. TaxID=2212460 RepID=UPI003BF22057
KRPVAKKGHESDLKERTLTNLYNSRPDWLNKAHLSIDTAVAAAYGWTDYSPATTDDEILKKLLALNLERSKAAEPCPDTKEPDPSEKTAKPKKPKKNQALSISTSTPSATQDDAQEDALTPA